MKILIETIAHANQRYPTPGDWQWEKQEDGSVEPTLKISVSKELSHDEAFLVALHELVEVTLCSKRGISQEAVDAFDMQYEKERAEGKHAIGDEPGDDQAAPYRKEHFFATTVERLMAGELGVDWGQYEKHLEALP